ncbi:uncharacterized protein SOCE26_078350 [Sorangium cellulosum]|uniref:Uncharacterized protein n=1 Tax=Sorangium cellulosum TaxID=56 RepID=A0A2L0F436_SORCE|nr:hypothetical protein [Sorangium cellulosum]AUX46330.1 uncharacterized protein SOCE26_078350 [Sorangium cellulosum]
MSDDGSITFIANHLPPLQDGSYTLQLAHQLQGGTVNQSFSKTYTFEVRGGARFTLAPDQIYKVFPPPSTLGDYDSLLPHVVLKRRTLPWERKVKDDPTLSWLALLVFSQSESQLFQPTIGTIDQLISPPTGTYSYGSVPGGITLEKGQKDGDSCVWLDLPASVFAKVAPSLSDLKWNAHARLRTDDTSSTDYAAVVANRVPPAGQTAVVHLVSLEGLGDVLPKDDGTSSLDGGYSTVRLASLKSWSFQVGPLQASFVDLLEALNTDREAQSTDEWDKQTWQSKPRDSQLRLPKDYRPAAAPAGAPAAPFDAGYTVLAQTAANQLSASWYRGPFMPSTVTPPPADNTWASALLPAGKAAALDVSVSAAPGTDCTYAAAWQIGRLLALADKDFATAQVAWKRDCRMKLNQAIRRAAAGPSGSRSEGSKVMRDVLKSASAIQDYLGQSLTTDAKTTTDLLIPQPLVDWLGQLAVLKSVPFNYLVPDAGMLPAESLRFLQVDPRWLACLLDGAWSLGREPADVWAFDKAYPPWSQLQGGSLCPLFVNTAKATCWPVSGALISSRLVSGYWPNIVFKTDTSAGLLRLDRLGPSTLLALFDGPFQKLTIQEPPEGIHFGFDMDDHGDLSKKSLRDANGNKTGSLSAIPQRGEGVIQLDQLATKLKTTLQSALSNQFQEFTAAELALELVEDVPGATFTLPG